MKIMVRVARMAAHFDHRGEQSANVLLVPVWPQRDDPDHPNRVFWDNQPQGQLLLENVKPDSLGDLEPGDYELTLTPAT